MKNRRYNAGFSLIEMIVVLAILAIVLTTIAISLTKRMDRLAGERETANLKKMSAAFKRSVEANRYIPDATNWVATVATQLGWHTNSVRMNERQTTRALLIDPFMQVGSSSSVPILPYTQSNLGSRVTDSLGGVIRPPNPRFMIISTMGSPLPAGIVSGLGATNGANAFTNIWATPDGSLPTGWTFANSNDLKIARIDLSDLFIPITLWNIDTTRIPTYGIDALTTNSVAQNNVTPPPAYYIRGTELKLYGVAGLGDLQYAEVVFTGHEFLFELGGWTAKSSLGRSVATPYGKDLQRALDLFLRAPVNTYAPVTATRAAVRDAMVTYMSAFIDWREAGYPGEVCNGNVGANAYVNALRTARSTLTGVSNDLITAR